MNTAAKGRRREHQSKRLLEANGYRVTRAAGSFGCWDLIAVGPDVLLIQVKSNRPPSPAERAKLAAFPCPPGCRRLVHVWRDRARQPLIVTELPGC